MQTPEWDENTWADTEYTLIRNSRYLLTEVQYIKRCRAKHVLLSIVAVSNIANTFKYLRKTFAESGVITGGKTKYNQIMWCS